MSTHLSTYLPPDRARALAQGTALPDRTEGSALFADIPGFTPMTEALVRALGPRQGAETLSQQINQIYAALIAQVEAWGGSAVHFNGDAITCWFDSADGPSAPRAAACALALQQTMARLAEVALSGNVPVALGLKVAVASGPVRRFAVGDPQIQIVDVLAGETLVRVAAAEEQANPGEIIIDEATAQALGGGAELAEWRSDPEGTRFGVLTRIAEPVPPQPLPGRQLHTLDAELLRPWIIPAIYARNEAGLGSFLTEMRPVVAMFVRFDGIDYDNAPDAQATLDRFTRTIQYVIARYDGTLLQITAGDKGSYLYATFGAPVAHEDDARRAVLTALELQQSAVAENDLAPLQIGVSQGVLLAGVYGGPTRQIYAVMGDEINLAARLMTYAKPGEILISRRVQDAIDETFSLEPRPPIQLKGKAEPQQVALVRGLRRRRPLRLEEPDYGLPLIGRRAEVAQLDKAIEQVLSGRGQVISVVGEAGLGKSRLITEGIRLARQRGLSGYGGVCQSTGISSPYLVWESIWRAFFDVDPDLPVRRQLRMLESALRDLAPERTGALPLLGPLIGVGLPENDLTRSLSPQDRQSALHALLRNCLVTAAREAGAEGGGLLLVLEDVHWIDAASHELLFDLAQTIGDLPVLILLGYRPPDLARLQVPRIEALPHTARIMLESLDGAEARELIRVKLRQLYPRSDQPIAEAVVAQLTERAQGNPFYLEELLNYLHDRVVDLRDSTALEALDLPDSLYSLVLSRLDQLSTHQQALLKSASVIGRRFVVTWLSGAFGTINAANTLMNDLSELVRTDLTALDTPEPELAYLFKHVVTQEVAYNSLSASTRAMLHEQLGLYLETLTSDSADQHIDLLAYHFDRSNNLAKRRAYLRRAGEAAIARFANEAALSYLNRAIELADESDLNERFDLLMAREQVYEYLARRDEQLADLATLTDLAERLDDRRRQALVAERRALHAVRTNDFAAVERAVQEAVALAREAGADEIAASAYIRWAWALGDHSDAAGARAKAEAALGLASAAGAHQRAAVALYTIGVIAEQQGEYASARAALLRALEVCRIHGYRREEAMVLTYLTNLSGSVGEFAAGASYADQALAILRAIGYPHGETIVLGYLGALAQQQGDYTKARAALEQALKLNRRRAHRLGESYCLHCLGVLADSVGDYEQARSLYDQALEIRQTLKDRWAEGATRTGLALLLHHQDDHAGALGQAQQALAIGRAVASLPGQAAALTVGGHALVALERLDEAEQSYREALELRRALGQAHLRPEALAGLARVALVRARPAEAIHYVNTIIAEQPFSMFDGTDEPLRIGLTCYEVLAALGDERAPALLAHHQRQIQARAAALPDERLRQRFAELIAQLQAARVQ